MPDESAEYGALFHLTCILYEGDLGVVTTGKIKAGGLDLEPTYTFTLEIHDGDYVSLFDDTANTADACGFLPCVETVGANTDAIIGRVIDEPRWSNVPQASQTTWADMLAGGWYRVATVEFMTLTGAITATVLGAAGMTVGCPVKWDVSADNYVDATATYTGAFSFHYYVTAAQTEHLIGFGQFAGAAGNTDLAGMDVSA